MFNLEQAMHAADIAALRSALRTLFADSALDVDGLASLVVTATQEHPGLLVIEAEYRDASGHVVGGFGV
jgi:hypothetical protein